MKLYVTAAADAAAAERPTRSLAAVFVAAMTTAASKLLYTPLLLCESIVRILFSRGCTVESAFFGRRPDGKLAGGGASHFSL